MKVSFCVVTRNRTASLKRTLTSILAGSADADVEILIVDNSDPQEFTLNREVCSLDARIRQIPGDPARGIAALRQVGVEESCGDVIAFVDDDVELPPEWLGAAVQAFQSDDRLGIYGCRVQNVGFDGKLSGYETHGFPKGHGSNGALKPVDRDEQIVTFGETNLALRRKFVLDAGGFDRRFKWGYEGVDLTQAMLSKGCRIYYAKDIVIKHYHDDYRSRSRIDRSEYYRLLFFFKHFGLKQFSLKYELMRVYYFLCQGYVFGAMFNLLLLPALPMIMFEAKRR